VTLKKQVKSVEHGTVISVVVLIQCGVLSSELDTEVADVWCECLYSVVN
jgi:hypothetical protein